MRCDTFHLQIRLQTSSPSLFYIGPFLSICSGGGGFILSSNTSLYSQTLTYISLFWLLINIEKEFHTHIHCKCGTILNNKFLHKTFKTKRVIMVLNFSILGVNIIIILLKQVVYKFPSKSTLFDGQFN